MGFSPSKTIAQDKLRAKKMSLEKAIQVELDWCRALVTSFQDSSFFANISVARSIFSGQKIKRHFSSGEDTDPYT